MNNLTDNLEPMPRQLVRREATRSCGPTSDKLSPQLFPLSPDHLTVTDGDTTRTCTCHADGQLATANYGRADIASQCSLRTGDMRTPQSETFLWDGVTGAVDLWGASRLFPCE